MERKFCINWSALVEEAKQRRKQQKLTQQRLALLAEVSTPTVSRFESGGNDIQLSSVMQILGVLGMVDHRQLVFPDPGEWYNPKRMSVIFHGRDGDKDISCVISRAALDDHFGSDKVPLEVFRANRERIKHEARRKYLSGQVEAGGEVLIKTTDL